VKKNILVGRYKYVKVMVIVEGTRVLTEQFFLHNKTRFVDEKFYIVLCAV
jgi:hypothetical protein